MEGFGFGGDDCAYAGKITESITGFVHDSGRLFPATIAPLADVSALSNFLRDYFSMFFFYSVR